MATPFECFLEEVLPGGVPDGLADRLRHIARALPTARGTNAALDRDGDHYVYILRGTAKLVAQASGGREQVVAFHFAGDLVHVPRASPHRYALAAITACELLVFDAGDALDVARSDARFAVVLLERMIGSLARAREVAVTLGRKRALERVATFLLSVRDRGSPQAAAEEDIALPMSRRDIAVNLAITVESISREVGHLREEHLIETPARARVRILDPVGLARRAGLLAGAA